MDNLDIRGIEMWLTVEAATAVLTQKQLRFITSAQPRLHNKKYPHNTCDDPLVPPPFTGPTVWMPFRVSLSMLCIQSYVR